MLVAASRMLSLQPTSTYRMCCVCCVGCLLSVEVCVVVLVRTGAAGVAADGRFPTEAATPSWFVAARPLQCELELAVLEGNPSSPPVLRIGGCDDDEDDEAPSMTGRLIDSGPGSK